jgi:hypothetical protein
LEIDPIQRLTRFSSMAKKFGPAPTESARNQPVLELLHLAVLPAAVSDSNAESDKILIPMLPGLSVAMPPPRSITNGPSAAGVTDAAAPPMLSPTEVLPRASLHEQKIALASSVDAKCVGVRWLGDPMETIAMVDGTDDTVGDEATLATPSSQEAVVRVVVDGRTDHAEGERQITRSSDTIGVMADAASRSSPSQPKTRHRPSSEE